MSNPGNPGSINSPVPIIIVQGAQYGSESKGMIAAYLCKTRGVDYTVRTGCINAGHTVYYNGVGYAMQQLPVGWVNPNTKLVLGPGAYIHLPTLEKEVDLVGLVTGEGRDGVLGRLLIDSNAGIHPENAQERSGQSGRHVLIGATGKGSSEAIMDRIRLRGKGGMVWSELGIRDYNQCLRDTSYVLNRGYDMGARILLEGTQGHGLDLLTGPYPYTTHKPCNASQWIVEAGLSPNLKYEVVLVARTMPIRVAGNSGPMHRETSWKDVMVRLNGASQDTGNGKIPVVAEAALEEWVHWLEEYGAETGWPGFPGMRQHLLVGKDREFYAKGLSECNAWAYSKCTPETKRELDKVMERTTVTKKPRRIGAWDAALMARSVQMNRPDWVAMTFLNYAYPETWGKEEISRNLDGMIDWNRSFPGLGEVPVKLVSTSATTLVEV